MHDNQQNSKRLKIESEADYSLAESGLPYVTSQKLISLFAKNVLFLIFSLKKPKTLLFKYLQKLLYQIKVPTVKYKFLIHTSNQNIKPNKPQNNNFQVNCPQQKIVSKVR